MPTSSKSLSIFAALAIAALLAVAAPATARDFHIGISANTRALDASEQDLVLETGAGWLREDLDWDRIEPSDDTWSWSWSDDWFETAAERGLRILPILGSPPCWAVPRTVGRDDCWRSYPVSDAEFAEYTAAVVARYGPGGTFWTANPTLDGDLAPRWFEVWNEPYFSWTSYGQVDPGRYAQLFRAASVAGRLQNASTRFLFASTVDVFDVTVSRWVNWAEAVVDASPAIGTYIDGIAVHPYPGEKDPDTAPSGGTDSSFKNTDVIWNDWVGEGIRKPIWITEVGYSSCDDGADECVPGATQSDRELQKAEWLEEIFDQLGTDAYGYVHAAFLYQLRQWSDIALPSADKEEWFGLLDQDGDPMPAWSVFADAVAAHDGVPVADSTITSQTLGSGTASFSFRADDPTATFECRLDSGAWTACTSPRSISGLTVGNHTFRVRAVNALATETTPAISVWTN